MDHVECVVIGAGVVGLAVARALAIDGRDVLVIEAAEAIGTGTSSRNSEVIHAGIYYPAGSLMARLCVAGRRQLYNYCAARGVPVRRCGKLIVATNAGESGKLDAIRAAAEANGAENMRMLSAAQAQALEPALACVAALLSPETGIFDSHAYMLALLADAEAAGAVFAFHSPAMSARFTGEGFTLEIGGNDGMRLGCRMLVNAAGLHAPDLARRIEGLPPHTVPQAYYAKGSYFTLPGRAPFNRLIYPVPVQGGLGIHLTLDLGGQAKFGPDVEWVDRIDHTVDPARRQHFEASIRRYWPGLPEDVLQPGYAGIRPKVVPPEIAKQDFTIQGPAAHGLPGLVNLFGIESPGLTASLAIGYHVCHLLKI